VVPSPQDYRDYRLSRVTAVKAALPDEFTFPFLVKRPYDQGDVAACVAFSLKAVKEMQEYKERGRFVQFSAAYIYGARGANDLQGEGMIPREALESLRKRGDCREELFPGIYPYDVCARGITPKMDEDARPQRIKTYAAVYTVEEVKTALVELGPVSVSIPVYDSFYQGGHLPNPDKSRERMRGFHMVTLVGWKKENRWLALNSWGQDWGHLRGYCTMPFDYPVSEMWAITDLTPTTQPDYEVALTRRGRYWGVVFNQYFRTSQEAREKLLHPLENDLKQAGKGLRVKRPY